MSGRHFVADNAEAIARGVAGFCAVHADLVTLHAEPRYVARATPATEKVGLVSGGGSGHEPLHAGFVGEGMLDVAVPGEVFASPSARQVRAATEAADNGLGVLHIVKNYTGDVINFRLAAEACRVAGIDVATVVVDDDVPGAERGSTPGRRGTVATVVVEKVCGAAAEGGMLLDDLQALGRRVVDASRSVGVAIAAGTSYGTGESAFDLADDEIEFGVGIHGERGTDRVADEGLPALVRRCLDTIADDRGGLSGRQLLIINGLGSTTPLELYAAYAEAASQLADRGVDVVRAVVDDLVTSLDMRGLSITLVAMDDELLRWWDEPARTPAWRTTPTAPLPAPRSGATEVATGERRSDDPAVDDRVSTWADRVVAVIDAEHAALGDLDRRVGDGDFGDNLATAARHYAADRAGGNRLLALADAFSAIGGSSGPLLAVWFSAIAANLSGTVDGAAIADGLMDGATAVRELGGAVPGDRTMVDAMAPAAVAAADHRDGSEAAVWAAAAHAASGAADGTSDLVARKGRSSYLGESVRGAADPGAIAVALFLEAARDVFSDHTP
ncbi:dihydroxyacetone kinase family protein [Propionibacteriaceae bacterium Y2011]|uniref:dihydroxyacetone kinase family protein n=1 Tax=Microlunatus sp. Y2014 TaxID=3418488 RepID=UPI003B4EBDCB